MMIIVLGRTNREQKEKIGYTSPCRPNAASSHPPRKLTPIQVLQRLLRRLEKRTEALQRVKLPGFEAVISELTTEMDYLRRAIR
jgi:hypothetical protein